MLHSYVSGAWATETSALRHDLYSEIAHTRLKLNCVMSCPFCSDYKSHIAHLSINLSSQTG